MFKKQYVNNPNSVKSKLDKQLKIATVLKDLGYDVDPDDSEEQQFACDLHGGEDSHPSARLYPQSNSWYCFACKKTRNIVTSVCDIRNLDYKEAIKFIFDIYNIQIEKDLKQNEEDPGRDLLSNLENFLVLLTKGRKLDKDKTIKIWSIFDNIDTAYSHKKIDQKALENLILKLKSRIQL